MRKLIHELRRRNVLRVGAAYVVLAWLLAQVAELALDSFAAPDWVIKTVLLLLALGLPLALFFAWAFELTPEGLKKEKDVDRSRSIAPQTGRKLDFAIIGILLAALAWFAWERFSGGEDLAAPPAIAERAQGAQADDGATAADKSIAVLPFVAMSSGPDDAYFADGLTEEILNALSQLPELLVTARTSAFSFKGKNVPVPEIAASLGVKHVVEGSVRKGEGRLRVTAQLVRAGDGFHLWSQTYDSSSSDAIAVQEDIAEKIATAMDIFLDENKREAMRKAGLRDVQAFTDYQKGMDLYSRAHGEIETIDGLRKANTYFERVIERAPESSRVYVLHSDLFVHILQDDVVGEDHPHVTAADVVGAYPAAIADYEAAVRTARTPAARVSADFNLAFVSGNWRGLLGRMEKNLSKPACPIMGNWLPNVALSLGYAEEYLTYLATTLSCDPRRSLVWFTAARAAFFAGDRAGALRLAREGADKAPGAWLQMALVKILVAEGRYEEARGEIEGQIQDAELAIVLRALIEAHQGRQQAFDELVKEYGTDKSRFWSLILQAWGGHRQAANAIAAEMDQKPFASVTFLLVAPWCACGAPWDLEATPNFAAKLKEGGLPWPPPKPMELPLKSW